MSQIESLSSFANTFTTESHKMPALFVGHGSPMNAIEQNEFSESWQKLGKDLPTPKAILCISAHWLTKGTFVTAMDRPKTIHDFGGFPQALFDVQYPTPGALEQANLTIETVKSTNVLPDFDWGLDHGTWSVLKPMYPKANIPTFQLSIDYNKPASFHYELGQQLRTLRNKGVLIVGSGNMVHNLGRLDFNHGPNFGFDWAIEMNTEFKKHILSGNHEALIGYEKFGEAGKLAIPTPDHYFPMLYVLGLQEKNERVTLFNDTTLMGSISMTSIRLSS